MTELDKDSAVSIYHQLASALRHQIISGELEPGAKLPPELELADKQGVSRGTARQAVMLLVSEGLVHRVQGKGTFVRALGRSEGRTGVIGLVVPYARDSLTVDILLGAESAAKSRGFSLMFSYTGEDVQQEAQDIRRMREENAAGLIVFPTSNITYDETIWQLHTARFPLVLVDRYFPGLPCSYVVVDNLGGAYRATEHLINLGHTSVAFVSTTGMQTTTVQDRFKGYQRALADRGYAYQADWLCGSSALKDAEAEVDAIRAYLRRPDRPRAFFAVNDYTALKVVRAAQAENLRVPDDVAVVGFDDVDVASQISVPLTTVSQPRYELGLRAAHSLIDRVQSQQPTIDQIVLPTTLVVRHSCGARRQLAG